MLSNWTKATTTTTGTGTITLAAVSGFPLPSQSRAVGEYVQYSINTSDGKYEAGIGRLAAGNTLERARVLSTYDGTTYNNTTASELALASGTHTVLITTLAELSFVSAKSPISGVSNNCVSSTHINASQSNLSAAAAVARPTAYPFRLETAGLLTGFSVNVATAGAGSTCHFGLYAVRPSDGLPAELIAVTSAEVDTSTTGYKTQTAATNKRIVPGWYWVAVVVTTGSVPSFTGGSFIRHALGGGGKDALASIRNDSAATTLDDPFPISSVVYVTNSTNNPLINLLIS